MKSNDDDEPIYIGITDDGHGRQYTTKRKIRNSILSAIAIIVIAGIPVCLFIFGLLLEMLK